MTDCHPTDPRWTKVLLREVKLPERVWEPAAGPKGNQPVVDVLRAAGHLVRNTDLIGGCDFLQDQRRAPAIVTNPPYSVFDEFARHALAQADQVVALLYSVSRMESRWFHRLVSEHPPSRLVVVCARMKVHGKVSSFGHGWLVWDLREVDPQCRVTWAGLEG